MPKVSVIVPVYNGELYIEECLESIVNQTLKSIEIIVVNDGCTDRTPEIINRFADNYTNIKVINQENQGLYRARQNGLKAATGDYVGWVDADDYLDLAMFETLYNIAVKNNSELVYSDYGFFPKKGRHKEKWYRPYRGILDTTYVELNSQPWNKLVKKDLLDRLGITSKFETCFDEIYIEIMLVAKNPVSVDKELYFYRMGQPTMSRSFKNVEHYERFIRASTALKLEMADYCRGSAYWAAYFEYREIYYMLQTMLIAANADNKEYYLRIKKELKSYPYHYHRNQHLKPIIDENFGKLKSFAIRNLVPVSYGLTRIMCKAAFR